MPIDLEEANGSSTVIVTHVSEALHKELKSSARRNQRSIAGELRLLIAEKYGRNDESVGR